MGGGWIFNFFLTLQSPLVPSRYCRGDHLAPNTFPCQFIVTRFLPPTSTHSPLLLVSIHFSPSIYRRPLVPPTYHPPPTCHRQLLVIIRQPLCPVVGRRPQHAVSKLPCLVLSSARSCRSSICLGRLSTAWLVSLVVFSCRMVSQRTIGRL